MSKLSDHEQANVEELCITARHQAAAVQQLEELVEQLEGVESDDAKSVADSVGTVLQYLGVVVGYNKNMLDDYGRNGSIRSSSFRVPLKSEVRLPRD